MDRTVLPVAGSIILADQAGKLAASRAGLIWINQTSAAILPLLILVAASILFGLLVAVKRASDRTTAVSLALVLGGGASNLADRILLGGVRDFSFFPGFGFNLADISILLGAALVITRFGPAVVNSK